MPNPPPHRTPQTVFLLGRSGNRLQALDMIMTETADLDAAILFCTEHEDDAELWDRLIQLAMSQPEHVRKLLNIAGNFIDPLSVIEKVRGVGRGPKTSGFRSPTSWRWRTCAGCS